MLASGSTRATLFTLWSTKARMSRAGGRRGQRRPWRHRRRGEVGRCGPWQGRKARTWRTPSLLTSRPPPSPWPAVAAPVDAARATDGGREHREIERYHRQGCTNDEWWRSDERHGRQWQHVEPPVLHPPRPRRRHTLGVIGDIPSVPAPAASPCFSSSSCGSRVKLYGNSRSALATYPVGDGRFAKSYRVGERRFAKGPRLLFLVKQIGWDDAFFFC